MNWAHTEGAVFSRAQMSPLYVENRTPTIIHDRSGRSDVFAWRLLSGPVLRIELLRPRKRPVVLYAHPDWAP